MKSRVRKATKKPTKKRARLGKRSRSLISAKNRALIKRVVEERLPPVRTTDQYDADRAAGIERVGKPVDARTVKEAGA